MCRKFRETMRGGIQVRIGEQWRNPRYHHFSNLDMDEAWAALEILGSTQDPITHKGQDTTIDELYHVEYPLGQAGKIRITYWDCKANQHHGTIQSMIRDRAGI